MVGCRRLAALTCVVGLAGASDAVAQSGQQIAYASDPDIKLIRPDGTGREVLTKSPVGYYNVDPGWSPDGAELGFVRRSDFDDPREISQLIVVDISTGRRRIVARDAAYGAPSFSPDGRSIAYTAGAPLDGEEYTTALRVVAPDGSGGRPLMPAGSKLIYGDPAWSPDGSTIAFTRIRLTARGYASGIWSVPAGGGGARRLMADAFEPAWAPDGSRIAFTSTRDRNGEACFHECSPTREVYVMGADGSNIRRLTRTKADEGSPAWSPDGSQIAFESSRPEPEDNFELYVMRSDGSCTTRLTNTSVRNLSPAWRPGGSYSAPLVCGGTVPGALMPVMETDLRPALRYRRFPLAWLGPADRGLLLSGLDVGEFVTFVYDDCGLVEGRCPVRELQVQTSSICRRHPLSYGGYPGPGEPDMSPHARRYRRVGDALLAEYPEAVDVYAGRITVTLFGPRFPKAAVIARRLDLFPRSRSALRAPRFDQTTLSRLRLVRGELRRYGMRELSRRWRMSPEQIRAALKLRRVVRRSELRRGMRCGKRT